MTTPRLRSAIEKVMCRNRRSGGGPVSAEAMQTRTLPALCGQSVKMSALRAYDIFR